MNEKTIFILPAAVIAACFVLVFLLKPPLPEYEENIEEFVILDVGTEESANNSHYNHSTSVVIRFQGVIANIQVTGVPIDESITELQGHILVADVQGDQIKPKEIKKNEEKMNVTNK